MNRPTRPSRLKWFAGSALAMALSGCITYTGDYADDGYYSTPERYGSYDPGYYGDYYYRAAPSITVTYNFYFGYPFYGYAGCSYWSPYCGLLYPGYGYAYGPGYGFGWGHGPHYGYEQPRHRPRPTPEPELPDEPLSPPSTGVDTPVVQNPIHGFPVNPIRPRPRLQSLPTPPVSAGHSNAAVRTPQSTVEAPQRTTYWRIPQTQRPVAPVYGGRAPVAREEVQVDENYVRTDPAQPQKSAAVIYRSPNTARNPVARQDPNVEEPERQQRHETRERNRERQAAREPQQARSGPAHRISAEDDGDP